MENGSPVISLLQNLCRLCLDNCGEFHMFQVENLTEDIELFFGVKVISTDQLPKQICSTCLDVINRTKNLRFLALKNETKLQISFHNENNTKDNIKAEIMELENMEEIETDIIIYNAETQNAASDNLIAADNQTNLESCKEGENTELHVKSLSVRKDLFSSEVTETSSCNAVTEKAHGENTINNITQKEDDEEFVCKVCYKIFETWKKFYLHRRTHAKTFSCPIKACDKKFSTKGDLVRHVRVHTGERPYQCTICDRQFTQKVTLRLHVENVHSKKCETKSRKPMTKEEVTLLVELVQGKQVLTSKTTNASTNKLKEEAWAALTQAFNSRSGQTPRQKEQLKLKWDNLKKAARKRSHQIRMNNFKTGGGKTDIPPDDILDSVAGMLGSACSGFDVPFGGDGIGVSVPVSSSSLPSDDDDTGIISFEVVAGMSKDNDAPGPPEERNTTCLYGMPKVASPLLINKGKKRKLDYSRNERNRAIAEYYKEKKKTVEQEQEKLDLEIALLKLEIEKNKHKY